jgi:hypothetical protein
MRRERHGVWLLNTETKPQSSARRPLERTGAMSELLQFIIVIAFGAFCFGCGYLTAFIVARNRWRDEMIKRGVARYNWQTGVWEWEPTKPY